MTDDLRRRIEKMENSYPAQVMICGETFKSINQRLEHGSVKFAEHEKEIHYLKECTKSVKADVSEIKAGWNKILSGIAVACILLVINALVTFYGG